MSRRNFKKLAQRYPRSLPDDGADDGAKSSARARTDRGSTSGVPRAGDKRHSNRSPVHNRSNSGRGEPDRKRSRPLSIGTLSLCVSDLRRGVNRSFLDLSADRKVVMDSNKGELRVNVSRTSARPLVPARYVLTVLSPVWVLDKFTFVSSEPAVVGR